MLSHPYGPPDCPSPRRRRVGAVGPAPAPGRRGISRRRSAPRWSWHPQRRIAPKTLNVRQRLAGTPSRTRRPRRARVASHFRSNTAFVQENQSFRVDPSYVAATQNVAVGWRQCLAQRRRATFFKRSPNSRNRLHNRPILALSRNSSRSRAAVRASSDRAPDPRPPAGVSPHYICCARCCRCVETSPTPSWPSPR